MRVVICDRCEHTVKMVGYLSQNPLDRDYKPPVDWMVLLDRDLCPDCVKDATRPVKRKTEEFEFDGDGEEKEEEE